MLNSLAEHTCQGTPHAWKFLKTPAANPVPPDFDYERTLDTLGSSVPRSAATMFYRHPTVRMVSVPSIGR
jgi:hypothetical protein